MKPITVKDRVASLLKLHKTYRATAKATGLSIGSLYAIHSGKSDETNLHVSTVRGLGLKCGPKFELE